MDTDFKDMSTDDLRTAVGCLEKGVKYLEMAFELVPEDTMDYAVDFSWIAGVIDNLNAALDERIKLLDNKL